MTDDPHDPMLVPRMHPFAVDYRVVQTGRVNVLATDEVAAVAYVRELLRIDPRAETFEVVAISSPDA